MGVLDCHSFYTINSAAQPLLDVPCFESKKVFSSFCIFSSHMLTKARANFKQDLHVLQLFTQEFFYTVFYLKMFSSLAIFPKALVLRISNIFDIFCNPLDESWMEGNFPGFVNKFPDLYPASCFQWYFSLIVFSAIRIRLKQDELSGKVARATERLVKGICGKKKCCPPNAESAYTAVANSNRSLNAGP